MKFIFEMPVYCGATKVWRVLNLSTGTIYSNCYETAEQAFDSIDDGKERSGFLVKAVSVMKAASCLDYFENH